MEGVEGLPVAVARALSSPHTHRALRTLSWNRTRGLKQEDMQPA
jgi:hypothetical protein